MEDREHNYSLVIFLIDHKHIALHRQHDERQNRYEVTSLNTYDEFIDCRSPAEEQSCQDHCDKKQSNNDHKGTYSALHFHLLILTLCEHKSKEQNPYEGEEGRHRDIHAT